MARSPSCAVSDRKSPHQEEHITETVARSLTKALLKRDFDLSLTLPDDRLCPPVPVRWNYIRWIQDLLDTTSDTYTDANDPDRDVTGLDIGVGASCIYPLLACASRPRWRMLGTDIDAHSLAYARRNVAANGLDARIRLALTAPESPLIPLGPQTLDFVMCNPPFYASEADMSTAYGTKAQPPSAICTGAPTEMIAPGGDAGFALRILVESLAQRDRVRWFSCMLGRLASVHALVAALRERGVGNFAVTNLAAGQRTRRWAVAWSFAGRRPRNDVARHGELVLALLPPATMWTVLVPGVPSGELGKTVHGVLCGLELRWQWRPAVLTGVAVARGNVWSRAARRKKKFRQVEASQTVEGDGAENDDEDGSDDDDENAVALAVKIQCVDGKADLRWLRGDETVLFESFCGMMKRALGVR